MKFMQAVHRSAHSMPTQLTSRDSHPFGPGLARRTGPVALGVFITGLLLCSYLMSVHAAEEPGLVTRTKEVAQETTAALGEAGRSAASEAELLWRRIDAARLKNRTPDEIVAWVIMGMLVGGLTGMLTSLKPTGLGHLGRLLLGLAGAFLGGIMVSMTHLDFGWGPVLIRYEALFFSFLGAILLIVLARLFRTLSGKKSTKH
jgi:uncharacterized membrane protein YeaQ/YmgE (transglycosylase-associated protein family)